MKLLFTKVLRTAKHLQWAVAMATVCLLTPASCIKDEALNKECDITSAWVEGEQYAGNFYQEKQMRMENISSSEKEVVFTVRSLISLPKQLPVCFTLTPGATISPASGSMQDFTAGSVTYTVTSEDGAWKREYRVVFKEASLPSYKFSFENVDTEENSSRKYHVFYETEASDNKNYIWASGNPGFALTARSKAEPEEFPTYSSNQGDVGKCVCLQTLCAGDLGKLFNKPIAAGNLYWGKFFTEIVLLEPLKATEFGIIVDREPIRVTGYYKYQPGKEFTNMKMEVDPNRTDEASIYAVFYRNTDEAGNQVKLYGDDVLTSPYIVSKAEVASLPPTDEWTRFEMFFEGAEADPEVLAQQGYNMTLVFSSSKEGASFEGAIGSVLYVDEVEVSFEKEGNE